MLRFSGKTINWFVETIGWIDLTAKSSFSKSTKVKQPIVSKFQPVEI